MNSNKVQQARSAKKSTRQSKSNPTSKRIRKSRNRNRGSPQPRVHLSACAADYALVKIDPFREGAIAPCIPDLLDVPSYKIKVLSRGSFVVGTAQTGWLIVASAGIGSEIPSAIVTTTGYTITESPDVPSTHAHYDYESRFPYNTEACPKTRIVASAIRVRYTGTELNRGGTLTLWANNSPVLGTSVVAPYFASADELKTLPDAKIYPVTNQWRTVAWNPSDPELSSYLPCDTVSSSDRSIGYPNNLTLVACATGVAGNSFEFERVSYYEMIPVGSSRTVPTMTKSHADPVGLGVVKDFLANSFVNYGPQALETFKSYAAKAAIASITTYTGTPGLAALPWREAAYGAFEL